MNLIKMGSTVLAAILAIGAVIALVDGRTILAGTLLLFTAFSIYARETAPEEGLSARSNR